MTTLINALEQVFKLRHEVLPPRDPFTYAVCLLQKPPQRKEVHAIMKQVCSITKCRMEEGFPRRGPKGVRYMLRSTQDTRVTYELVLVGDERSPGIKVRVTFGK